MPLNARVGIDFITNAPEWKKSVSDMRKFMESELSKANVKIKPPKIPPPESSSKGRGSNPKNDPLNYSAVKDALAKAKAAEEKQAKELDKIRESLRAKTKKEEKKLVDDLVNEQARLQARVKVLNNAIDREHDATTKKILARERQKVREITRLNDQALKERNEVQRAGAGSKVGILGTFRNIIPGSDAGGIGGLGGMVGKGGGWIGAGVAGLTALAAGYQTVIAKGAGLQTQMADLSAITGLQGQALRDAGADAREMGIKYNIDATAGVESMKLIISALGPEVAKNRVALKGMTDTTLEFSKAAGVDAATATDTLTVTISEFGFAAASTEVKAQQMQRAANIIAAAAKEGSAEADDLGKSMKVAGATANSLGVSMEQTAALLELVAPAGLKAEQGGTAVRNILLKMSSGSKEANEALQDMGITFHDINPQNVGITKALENLKEGFSKLHDPVQRANAIQRLFGLENANAAQFLMDSSDQLDVFTGKITNTTEAQEMAATKMNTLSERWGRFGKQIDEVALKIFDKMEPGLNRLLSGIEKQIPAFLKFAEAIGSVLSGLIDFIEWNNKANESMHNTIANIASAGVSQGMTAEEAANFERLTGRRAVGVTPTGTALPPSITPAPFIDPTQALRSYYTEQGRKAAMRPARGGGGGKGKGGGGKSKKDEALDRQVSYLSESNAESYQELNDFFNAIDEEIDKRFEEQFTREQEQWEKRLQLRKENIGNTEDLNVELMEEGRAKEEATETLRYNRQLIALTGQHDALEAAQKLHEQNMHAIKDDHEAKDKERITKQIEDAKDFVSSMVRDRAALTLGYQQENDAINSALLRREITGKEAAKRRNANEEKYQQDKLALSQKYDALEFALQKFGLTRNLEQLAISKGEELAIWIAAEFQKTAATETNVFARIGLMAKEMWASLRSAAVSLYNASAKVIEWAAGWGGPLGIALIGGAGIAALYGLWEGAKALFAPKQELASGAIVRARNGGVNAVIGEGGSDEAVIPLNKKSLGELAAAFIDAIAKDSRNGGPGYTVLQDLAIEKGGVYTPPVSRFMGNPNIGRGSSSFAGSHDVPFNFGNTIGTSRFMPNIGNGTTRETITIDVPHQNRSVRRTPLSDLQSQIGSAILTSQLMQSRLQSTTRVIEKEVHIIDPYGVKLAILKDDSKRNRNNL